MHQYFDFNIEVQNVSPGVTMAYHSLTKDWDVAFKFSERIFTRSDDLAKINSDSFIFKNGKTTVTKTLKSISPTYIVFTITDTKLSKTKDYLIDVFATSTNLILSEKPGKILQTHSVEFKLSAEAFVEEPVLEEEPEEPEEEPVEEEPKECSPTKKLSSISKEMEVGERLDF